MCSSEELALFQIDGFDSLLLLAGGQPLHQSWITVLNSVAVLSGWPSSLLFFLQLRNLLRWWKLVNLFPGKVVNFPPVTSHTFQLVKPFSVNFLQFFRLIRNDLISTINQNYTHKHADFDRFAKIFTIFFLWVHTYVTQELQPESVVIIYVRFLLLWLFYFIFASLLNGFALSGLFGWDIYFRYLCSLFDSFDDRPKNLSPAYFLLISSFARFDPHYF